MAPSVGRIVLVTLSETCATLISGNCRAGDKAPAIVTAVFPCGEGDYLANVRILGDGPGTPLWSTLLSQGTEPGQWEWPERVEKA